MARQRRSIVAANLFVGCRVTPTEREELQGRARAAGLSVGAFLRSSASLGSPSSASIVAPSDATATGEPPAHLDASSDSMLVAITQSHVERAKDVLEPFDPRSGERSTDPAFEVLPAQPGRALPRYVPDFLALVFGACPDGTYIVDAWAACGKPATLDAFKEACKDAARAEKLVLVAGDLNHPSAAASVVRRSAKQFRVIARPA